MANLDQLNWDDVRVFVTLTRSTSLREAAEQLGLTHPTVRKRLDALEATLGVKLFFRRPDGLHITAQGEELADAALDVQRSMKDLSRRARAIDHDLQGPIRVTMNDELARLLTPAVADFASQWPQTPVVLDVGNDFADLDGRGVDVAVRILGKGRQPDGHLTGRRAVKDGANAVYGDVKTGRWIGVREAPPQTGWTATNEFSELPVGATIANGVVRREACKRGMGIAMLPCLLGDPDLPRLTKTNKAFDIWVLVHPDLRRKPQLRLFRDAMVEGLRELKGVMQGRG